VLVPGRCAWKAGIGFIEIEHLLMVWVDGDDEAPIA